MSALIFIISFFLLALGSFCSSLSSFLRWEFRLFIRDLSSFLKESFRFINSPFGHALAESDISWYAAFSFLFSSTYFFNIFWDLTFWPIGYLEVYYLSSKCLEIFLLYLCNWLLLDSTVVREQHTLYDFSSDKCVSLFYCPGHVWSWWMVLEKVFTLHCSVKYPIYVNLILLVDSIVQFFYSFWLSV